MRHTRIQTPKGTKDFLPADCARKALLEGLIASNFERWGYSEVITPTCEFQDVVLLGQGGVPDEAMYKLNDREGNTIVLRPDMTMPIGRVVATRMRDLSLPYRLYYVSNVFRHTGIETGRQREFYQAGVELLGASGPAADAEVIALAASILRQAGLSGVCFDIGHVGFVQALLEAGDFDEPERLEVTSALVSKDYVGFDDYLAEHSRCPAVSEILRDIPRMRGGRELIVSVRQRVEGYPAALRALDEIDAVIEYLEDYGVGATLSIDLGMIKDFDYYTGVTIEGYVRELGAALCSGGRYDSLTEHFGFRCPATGFALGIEWLMAALERQGHLSHMGASIAPDVVATLPGDGKPGPRRSEALKLVDALRTAGLRVMVELVPRTLEETVSFAAQRGATWLLILGDVESSGELRNLAVGHSHGSLSFTEIQSVLGERFGADLRGESRSCQASSR